MKKVSAINFELTRLHANITNRRIDVKTVRKYYLRVKIITINSTQASKA